MFNVKLLSPAVFVVVLILFGACSNTKIETDDNFEVVELPDGSMAFLNHHSSLVYDENFEPRKIELQGEMFLSVKKNETPFMVSMDLGELTVTGTEFNVNSDKNKIEVEVEEGSVELKTKQNNNRIRQGERAHYEKDGNEIKMGEAEFKFKIWLNNLHIEFKKLGKEIKHGSKHIEKESKEMGKELKKEIKKLNIK